MVLPPEKSHAVLSRLGKKDRTRRRGPHRPAFLLGQFSLAALVALVTAASVLLAVWHYQESEIRSSAASFERRARSDVHSFPETPADEFVPPVVGLVCGLLAIAVGFLVYRLPAERGLIAVWVLASLAFVGLLLAVSLPVRPLDETRLRQLEFVQLLPAILLGLGCLMPVASAVGWYAKFASGER